MDELYTLHTQKCQMTFWHTIHKTSTTLLWNKCTCHQITISLRACWCRQIERQTFLSPTRITKPMWSYHTMCLVQWIRPWYTWHVLEWLAFTVHHMWLWGLVVRVFGDWFAFVVCAICSLNPTYLALSNTVLLCISVQSIVMHYWRSRVSHDIA